MNRYAFTPKGKHAKSSGYARVSPIHSVTLCRSISGLSLQKAKSLLEGLANHTHPLRGRYYDRASAALLSQLTLAEHNAEFQGLDTRRLLVHASAHKAFSFVRPRRFSFRRRQIKAANLQIVLRQA